MIRAVSFDLFDTLVDLDLSGEPLQESVRRLHEALAAHLPLDFEAFVARAREADRALRETQFGEGIEIRTEERFAHLLDRLGVEHGGLVETLTGIHMGVLRGRVRVPPHHASVLERLRRRARVGVCSNFTHSPTARRILEESALAPHLDPVVISADVGRRKPRREIFEALLAGLGTPPGETLHVGDNLRSDVGGAAALGLRTAWLTRRVRDPEAALAAYDGPRPGFVLRDLGDVFALLDAA